MPLTTLENHLLRTAPEHQGISSSSVLQFADALNCQIHEIHSFMLLRHGHVIAEAWWAPYKREQPHLLFSLSKSFTSTAVGFAINEGYFAIDDRVVSFFPEYTPADMSDLLAALRVRDLLSMTTGQAVDTWSFMVDRTDGNWIKGFLEVPVLHTPGTHFLYNTGATYMLSAIVQKTTGMKLVDYLQPRLFTPLGIENAIWTESPQGITAGGIGLSLNTEGVARFGQLYLQKGKWQGRQLLPEAWVDAATSFQISNGDDPARDWTQGYGYQFWRCRHDAYRGDGVFGQFCIVMPEQDAVLAITAGVDVFDMQHLLNLVWDILLPAMGSAPLLDDAIAHEKLSTTLSTFAFSPVQGQATSSGAAQGMGRTYRVDDNALKLKSITFNVAESGYEFIVSTPTGAETIPCGYGTWQQGQTSVFNQPLLFDHSPVSCSGAWTAENTFTMIARLIATPFYHTVVCHFVGSELLVEISVNVSLESLEPLLLTARAAS